ncbi:MAG: pantetheine-phosphate adenylyltransferase [Rickettsiales bacterium]|nr:MAG: pantetheine-phosphate adenylyltransferase [Rickettsiales bacterium]
MKKVAIYPGTFDPITNGHLDIIQRASKIVDELVIAVAEDTGKTTLFTQKERTELVENEVKNLANVKVASFSGLVVNFFKEHQATFVIRGVRTIRDFENEFNMAIVNKKLFENYETLFIPANEIEQFTSSTNVRTLIKLGANIDNYVSLQVKNAILEKVK